MIYLEAVLAMAIASNDPHPSVQRQRLSGLGRLTWELSGAPETSYSSSSDGWKHSDSLPYIACFLLSSLEDSVDDATDLMLVCGRVRCSDGCAALRTITENMVGLSLKATGPSVRSS